MFLGGGHLSVMGDNYNSRPGIIIVAHHWVMSASGKIYRSRPTLTEVSQYQAVGCVFSENRLTVVDPLLPSKLLSLFIVSLSNSGAPDRNLQEDRINYTISIYIVNESLDGYIRL